jgi:hypothetical protein
VTVIIDPNNVTNHSVTVTGLNPGTQYTFTIKSKTPSGKLTTSTVVATTAAPPDVTPDVFSFTPVTGAALSTLQTSNTITVSGLSAGVSVVVSVTGGMYSKNGGAFTGSAGTAQNGDTFAVRGASSASNSTLTSVVLTIGGVSGTFAITTVSASGAPVNLTIPQMTGPPARAGVALLGSTGTWTGSPTFGFRWYWQDTPGTTISTNSGSYTPVNGDVGHQINFDVTATESGFSTTVTSNGPSSAVLAATPDPFSFTPVSNAALSTVQTSNTITVSGLTSSTSVSIVSGTYSKNGGAYVSSSGTANNGDTFSVRQTSSAANSTETDTTLTIGGQSGIYKVTTLASSGTFDGTAELPRSTPDTTMPTSFAATNDLSDTGNAATNTTNLQNALNTYAAINDSSNRKITLAAGAQLNYGISIPNRVGTGWIVVASRGSIPAEGVRAQPTDGPQMPKFTLASAVNSTNIFSTAGATAHHYWFIGLQLTNAGPGVGRLVQLGNGTTDQTSGQPHHIIWDRCYFWGGDTHFVRVGIKLDCGEAAVINCNISGVRSGVAGNDSQCINGINGSGPYLIKNNYLEGASENIMFGGGDSSTPGHNPSDITVTGNHFTKKLAWVGTGEVNNLFELKMGIRVLVEKNILENCFTDGQKGHCFRMKSENQGGTSSWIETGHVTVRFNKCHTLTNPINLSATGGANPAVNSHDYSFHDNEFYDIGEAAQTGNNILIQTIGPIGGTVNVSNNTFAQNANQLAMTINMGGTSFAKGNNLILKNNILAMNGVQGYRADGGGEGTGALTVSWTTFSTTGNLIYGSYNGHTYPAGNTLVAALGNVQFTNIATNDYTLVGGSAATSSGDTSGGGTAYSGANITAVESGVVGVP